MWNFRRRVAAIQLGPFTKFATILALTGLAFQLCAPSWLTAQDTPPTTNPERWRGPQPAEGRNWPEEAHFFQRFWYQMGEEFHNPSPNKRFRVNDPYVATHPKFHSRSEPKGNGLMLIPMLEPTRDIEAARLVLELWGGHPDSSQRRVTVNGRSTYPIAVADERHCTHAYPNFPIKITDLVQGYNALQFAVDGEHTFWGHFIVDEAAIDVLLPTNYPRLSQFAELLVEPPQVRVDTSLPEVWRLTLDVPARLQAQLEAVHYFAYYDGFDENGDGHTRDWHGMTKHKLPVGHVGTATVSPYAVRWDTSFLPAQRDVRVRACLQWRNEPDQQAQEELLQQQGHRYWKAQTLYWQSAPSPPLEIVHPAGVEVRLVTCDDSPVPFWSRAGRERTCKFSLPEVDGQLARAQLQVCVWDGGAGQVDDYFTLNSHPLSIAATGAHDVIYSTHDVPVAWLQHGINTARLLSDTEHHGIEILFPGPTLSLRYQVAK